MILAHFFLFLFLPAIKIGNAIRLTLFTSYIHSPNKFINNNKRLNYDKFNRKFVTRLGLVDESIKNNEHIIKLTDNAKNKIEVIIITKKNNKSSFIKEKEGKENLILKLSVKNGGCKGLQYKLNPIKKDEIEADDYIQQFEDLHFILSIEATSVIYIYNNILDYSNDLINGGFKYVFIMHKRCTDVIILFDNLRLYRKVIIPLYLLLLRWLLPRFINPNATKKCGCGKSFNV
ncbi:iron-sulfur assembly protein (SufA) [Plasmodium malariae]|uniref:Iron-sulfur assembly protein (SufA) n=1 Tax=Plasmodium malariae TaxID=5858 RepID=A0A1A8W016_PLAMA|nr:iron-sulfur assembly protein (SufA) [Plasmodium malariae]